MAGKLVFTAAHKTPFPVLRMRTADRHAAAAAGSADYSIQALRMAFPHKFGTQDGGWRRNSVRRGAIRSFARARKRCPVSRATSKRVCGLGQRRTTASPSRPQPPGRRTRAVWRVFRITGSTPLSRDALGAEVSGA